MDQLAFQAVSFNYESMSKDLFTRIVLNFPSGWTGVVGANGAGKTTILRLATGSLVPVKGSIKKPGETLYCPQRTDDPPAGLDSLLDSLGSSALALRGRLGIEDDWIQRWETLSHGERKRAQVGVALWTQPAVLAVDEPTNHLDAPARQMLYGALRSYSGIGLLVSHDRMLLDKLCRQCVFIDPPEVLMRPGGYTQGNQAGDSEQQHLHKKRETAQKERQKIEREVVRRRQEASLSHKRRSKRNLGKDNDARFKRNLARNTGKDGQAGRLLKQLEGRLQRTRDKHQSVRVKKIHELGIWTNGERSKRDTLLNEDPGGVSLGERRELHFPRLVMLPADRIALTGPNGGGKSTLIHHLLRKFNVDADRMVYVPQEIDIAATRGILNEVRMLPHDRLGSAMNVVSCLGSRPERLLESELPSPGEIRKVLFALGIVRTPHLIVMDEPTNHMDLPSIECLEEALDDCPCGLILVSHDERFLRKLTHRRWRIGCDASGCQLQVEETPAECAQE